MNTIEELVAEMRRLILYELQLGDANAENAEFAKAINRAYAEVCYYSETPVLMWEAAYGANTDPGKLSPSKDVIDLSEFGLRSVYRIWWRTKTGPGNAYTDEIDLMDALYLQPEQDYRHLGAQRVLPDPTKEYRFSFPRVRWLPQRIRRGTSDKPTTYAFADGKIFLDTQTDEGVLRIIGAFVPSEKQGAPVPVLIHDAVNKDKPTLIPRSLNEAVLYLAMSYWLMPYPDAIQLTQFYRMNAFETIQMHVNVAQTGAFSRSPYAYAENMMGVINQETARRQKKSASNEQ